MRERIKQFICHSGLSIADFEKNCGLANGTIAKVGNNTRRSTLDRISSAYPDLNINWLLTGEGEMLKSQTRVINSNNTNSTINESSTIAKLIEMLDAKDKQLAEKDKQIEVLLKLLTK